MTSWKNKFCCLSLWKSSGSPVNKKCCVVSVFVNTESGIYLGFQKGMGRSYKNGHLLAQNGTSPGRGDIFS
jgi:hypothetical protein